MLNPFLDNIQTTKVCFCFVIPACLVSKAKAGIFVNLSIIILKINPAEILIKDYTYELPAEKIAQFPLKERDSSKLLIYNKGAISQDTFLNIIV